MDMTERMKDWVRRHSSIDRFILQAAEDNEKRGKTYKGEMAEFLEKTRKEVVTADAILHVIKTSEQRDGGGGQDECK